MKQRIFKDTLHIGGYFDTIKMMREIRDKISYETQNMTLEELKKYIDSRIKEWGLD